MLAYVLTTRAERERRPPSIAIAWVLGMIAVPYLALPMYLLFGRRKLPRKFCAGPGVGPHCAHWAEDLIESFGLAACSPCVDSLCIRTAANRPPPCSRPCRARPSRLDICTYILGDDAFGREAMQRMIERARGGVQVRLLIDGVGAMQMPRALLQRNCTPPASRPQFSVPLFARKTQGPRNLRNHRKMVIADGARLWAGGRNLAAEYFTGRGGAPPWRDLSFDLQGRSPAAAAAQFEADWVAAGGKPAAAPGRSAAPGVGLPARRPRPIRPPAGAVSAQRSGSDRRYRACLADRCMLSRPRAHARRDALLRARCEPWKPRCAWPRAAA